MALMTKITAVAPADEEDRLKITVDVYDTKAPVASLWTGQVIVKVADPPEKVQAAIDDLVTRYIQRQERITELQTLVDKPQPSSVTRPR
jgi:hypothetical protein